MVSPCFLLLVSTEVHAYNEPVFCSLLHVCSERHINGYIVSQVFCSYISWHM